ncbi:unnamed protein product [Paramecium primaurelia]|uniref:Transmembrane protein n=1 Tax=Paramecium primaurelia TaxID=5886 RepID=A0A8S1LMF8_PARPR|nr:unnamed protein product [Paramecium primaurelia]
MISSINFFTIQYTIINLCIICCLIIIICLYTDTFNNFNCFNNTLVSIIQRYQIQVPIDPNTITILNMSKQLIQVFDTDSFICKISPILQLFRISLSLFMHQDQKEREIIYGKYSIVWLDAETNPST